jgi:hypothetical protein
MFPLMAKGHILDARLLHTGLRAAARRSEMFELGVLMLCVVGACWLFGALIGGLFKLTFGLLGVVFGGLFGLLTAVLVALLVVPVVLLALLPLMLPALCIAALVWLIVHASRPHPAPVATTQTSSAPH